MSYKNQVVLTLGLHRTTWYWRVYELNRPPPIQFSSPFLALSFILPNSIYSCRFSFSWEPLLVYLISSFNFFSVSSIYFIPHSLFLCFIYILVCRTIVVDHGYLNHKTQKSYQSKGCGAVNSSRYHN